MTDTSRLDAALDDCKDRLAAAQIVLDEAQSNVAMLTLERDTLHRAKVLVTPQAEAPTPAKPKRVYKRKEPRAALPSAEHVPNRKDEGKTSLPPDDPKDGAGIPEMPAFLRQQKTAAE